MNDVEGLPVRRVMSTRNIMDRARTPERGRTGYVPPGGFVVRFTTTSSVWSSAGDTRPVNPWSAWSPWPGHPAIQPPLPCPAKSSAFDLPYAPPRETPRMPARSRPLRTPAPARPALARPAPRMPATRSGRAPAPARPMPRQATAPVARPQPQHLEWPASFDDWMIDIVRRRALRLNSGARRRGVFGSVRAVEMAQVLERSKDAKGQWLCGICKTPVTLHDLSFDHVIALADGGEHAAHNLAPAHRKCNEIKGSEKAQHRAHALDRWFDEWTTNGSRSRTAS